MTNKIAVIRIKGGIGLNIKIKDTFNMLRLYKKNNCVVLDGSPSNIGMIEKMKTIVTWGEIDQETLKSLLINRGRLPGNKKITEDYIKEKTKLNLDGFIKEVFESKKKLKDIPGLKLFFKLKPPTNGFERKGVKVPYSLGGVYGYRKEMINDLIKRMI